MTCFSSCKTKTRKRNFIEIEQYFESLSVPLYFVGLITSVDIFLLPFYCIFWGEVSLHTSATTNCFLRRTFFVGFSEFPSLVHWCTVTHQPKPQRPTLFQRQRHQARLRSLTDLIKPPARACHEANYPVQ